MHLERVEDDVDAVVCAYIALYATAKPQRVRVLGNVENGYILTPVTPQIAQRLDVDSRTPTAPPESEGDQPHPGPIREAVILPLG